MSYAASGCAPATVSGSTITSDETWTQACSPYIVTTNVTVRNGAILTIEPGVEVRFNSSRYLAVSTISLAGGLVAAGTAAEPIVFTSNLASPSPGSWGGLRINRKVISGSVLSHSVIEYAGVAPALKLDRVPRSEMTLSNIEITDCSGEGVSIIGADPSLELLTVDCPASTKHGVVASLDAAFAIESGTIRNALSMSGSFTSVEVSDTTFTDYDGGLPFSLDANFVGMIVGDNTVENTTPASVVNVAGAVIRRDSFWPALSYRVSDTVHVRDPSGPMLTIAAGAELRFDANGKLIVSNFSTDTGGIQANGSPTSPILFTSNAATPAANDWNGVFLKAGLLPGSGLSHVIIEYTGPGPALELDQVGADVPLENGTIRLCDGEGVEASSGSPVLQTWIVDCSAGDAVGILATQSPDLTLTGSTVANGLQLPGLSASGTISGNTFVGYDEGPPLRLHAARVDSVLASNTLEEASASSVVEVEGGEIGVSASWPALTYRILDDVEIKSGSDPTLTLAPGTTFRFASQAGLLVGSIYDRGGLRAEGTAADPVRFTSDNASPSAGDWRGIRFAEAALDSSRLEWVHVEYAGWSIYPAVEIYGADVTLENATIENNDKDGVTIREASPTLRSSLIRNNGDNGIECSTGATDGYFPRILGSQITGNADRGIYCKLAFELSDSVVSGSTIGVHVSSVEPLTVLRNNDLSGNTTAAVDNDDSGAGLDARLNWFGTASDPASSVQGEVLTNPWLGSSPSTSLKVTDASLAPESFVPLDNEASIAAALSGSASWDVGVRDSTGGTVRTFSGAGSTLLQPWDGSDAGGAAVADGTYTVELNASAGAENAAPVVGRLSVDAGLLIAQIEDPAPLAVLPGTTVQVDGTTDGASFASYTLDYGVGASPGAFTQIATGSTAITSGALGSWDTTGLLEGVYTLRLRTFPTSGSPSEDRVDVKVLRVFGSSHDDYFSPNADGVKDTARIEATASVAADWTVSISDGEEQLIRVIEGTGMRISADWDGSTDAGPVAPDGSYTYTVSVGGGVDELDDGPTVLDTVAPDASFSSPMPGSAILTYAPLEISGTASDLHFENYDLSYQLAGSGSWSSLGGGSSAVVGGTLGSLPGHSTLAPLFLDEQVTVRLEAHDLAGNVSTQDLSLQAELIAITGVQSTPSAVIDPYLGESAAIAYDLSRPANVTIEFYRSSSWVTSPSLVASIVDGAARSAGSNVDLWDGRDASSGAIPESDGYYYSILATDAAGRSSRFNDPAAPELEVGFVSYDSTLKLNGEPFSPADWNGPPLGPVVDPYRNDELHLEWTPTADMANRMSGSYEVSVYISADDGTVALIEEDRTWPAGVPVHIHWDGRREDGSIVDVPFDVITGAHRAAEKRLIFLEHDFRIIDARTNPYVFHPRLAGATNLRFELPEAADVEIDLIDPNGNFLFTLQESTPMASGVHEISWDGRDPSGDVVSLEGSYVLEVRAQSSVSGELSTRRVSALVYR